MFHQTRWFDELELREEQYVFTYVGTHDTRGQKHRIPFVEILD